jgi:diacylglycerol kinase (ATP)
MQVPHEPPILTLHEPSGLAMSTQGTSRSRKPRLGAWTVAGDLPSSFRYAAQGVIYGFRSQRNFRIHVGTVATVLVLELLNTATEAVVDLAIGRSFHPLAKIAKDCAAAAVLVAALASLLVAGLLLLPPLMLRLGL